MTPAPRSEGSVSREEQLNRVVDAVIVALQEFSTEDLRWVADEAKRQNPEGWLGTMICEYVDVWR